MGDTLTLLRKANRKLGTTGKRWTKNDYAKDGKGDGVPPNSPNAKCFCAEGACLAAAGRATYEEMEAINTLQKVLPKDYMTVPAFNDMQGRRFRSIKALFRRAIALAKREGL